EGAAQGARQIAAELATVRGGTEIPDALVELGRAQVLAATGSELGRGGVATELDELGDGIGRIDRHRRRWYTARTTMPNRVLGAIAGIGTYERPDLAEAQEAGFETPYAGVARGLVAHVPAT